MKQLKNMKGKILLHDKNFVYNYRIMIIYLLLFIDRIDFDVFSDICFFNTTVLSCQANAKSYIFVRFRLLSSS